MSYYQPFNYDNDILMHTKTGNILKGQDIGLAKKTAGLPTSTVPV
jgi:hypothetical protein